MPWGPEGSSLRACPAPPRMLQSVRELEATSSGAGAKAKAAAFQHLLLLVGIYLFKVWHLGSGAPQLSSRRGWGRGWGLLWVDHSPRRVAPCTSWPVVS